VRCGQHTCKKFHFGSIRVTNSLQFDGKINCSLLNCAVSFVINCYHNSIPRSLGVGGVCHVYSNTKPTEHSVCKKLAFVMHPPSTVLSIMPNVVHINQDLKDLVTKEENNVASWLFNIIHIQTLKMHFLNIITTQYLWLRLIDSWQYYINIIIVILDIIHRPVIYLEQNFSDSSFCIYFQVVSLLERGTSSVDWAQLSRYHLKI
jgi:hypothetical protein